MVFYEVRMHRINERTRAGEFPGVYRIRDGWEFFRAVQREVVGWCSELGLWHE